MADAVATKVILNDGRYYAVTLTNVSDGTGESAVVKVDRSALADADGVEPTKMRILQCQWSVQGFPYAKLAWDHDTDDVALVLGTGVGKLCFEKVGGLKDPASAGGTGDLLLTAPAGATTGSYTIVLLLGK